MAGTSRTSLFRCRFPNGQLLVELIKVSMLSSPAVIGNRALRFGARRPRPQAAFVHPRIKKDRLNLPDFVGSADPHQCGGAQGKREFVQLRSDQEADDLFIDDDEEARDSLRLLA